MPWQYRGDLEQLISRPCTPADPAFSLTVFLSPACLCQPFSAASALLGGAEELVQNEGPQA